MHILNLFVTTLFQGLNSSISYMSLRHYTVSNMCVNAKLVRWNEKCLYNKSDLRSPDMLYKESVQNIETRNSITQPSLYYLRASDFISAAVGSKLCVCMCVYVWTDWRLVDLY